MVASYHSMNAFDKNFSILLHMASYVKDWRLNSHQINQLSILLKGERLSFLLRNESGGYIASLLRH